MSGEERPGLWPLATRFSLSGFAAFGVALWLRGPWLWLLWPAASWLGLTWAYLANRPQALGKRTDGALRRPSALLFLPHLAASEAYFHCKRLFLELEPCWNEVAPGLYIGRRPLPRELPGDVRWIVDLTAELYEPAALVRHGHYRYLPALNRWAPADDAFHRLARELATIREPVYVHCGSGLGRSATMVAAILVLRGLEPDVDHAERRLQRLRPRVYLHPAQRSLVARQCGSALEVAEAGDGAVDGGDRRQQRQQHDGAGKEQVAAL